MSQEEINKELTPEEVAEQKAKMEKFIDEELPFLRKQAEYEELQAKIEEARFRQVNAQVNMARMFMRPETEEDPKSSSGRKLKNKEK